jgi:hypothetical protein
MPAVAKGFTAAIGLMTGGAATVAMFLVGVDADFALSDEALSDIAHLGATLLVAYAVEISWFVKESSNRGSRSENWLGFVVGIGVSSALGIAIAVALVGRESSGFLASMGATWMLFALGLLALLVATLPYLLYELAHAARTEYPDE